MARAATASRSSAACAASPPPSPRLRARGGADDRAPRGVRCAARPGQSRGAVPGARRAGRGPRLRPQPARPGPGGRGHRRAAAIEASGLAGRLVVLGCPAEELLWGKLALLDRGGFAGDRTRCSPLTRTTRTARSRARASRASRASSCSRGSRATAGLSAATMRSGAGAGDAARSTDLRGSRFHGFVIGHVVRAGGLMPSITPDEARLWLTVRHESFEAARDAYREIAGLARDAARMAGRQRPRAAGRGEPRLSPERRPGPGARRQSPARRPAGVEPPTTSRGWRPSRGACDPAAPFELDREHSPPHRRAVIPTARTTARRAGASRSGG